MSDSQATAVTQNEFEARESLMNAMLEIIRLRTILASNWKWWADLSVQPTAFENGNLNKIYRRFVNSANKPNAIPTTPATWEQYISGVNPPAEADRSKFPELIWIEQAYNSVKVLLQKTTRCYGETGCLMSTIRIPNMQDDILSMEGLVRKPKDSSHPYDYAELSKDNIGSFEQVWESHITFAKKTPVAHQYTQVQKAAMESMELALSANPTLTTNNKYYETLAAGAANRALPGSSSGNGNRVNKATSSFDAASPNSEDLRFTSSEKEPKPLTSDDDSSLSSGKKLLMSSVSKSKQYSIPSDVEAKEKATSITTNVPSVGAPSIRKAYRSGTEASSKAVVEKKKRDTSKDKTVTRGVVRKISNTSRVALAASEVTKTSFWKSLVDVCRCPASSKEDLDKDVDTAASKKKKKLSSITETETETEDDEEWEEEENSSGSCWSKWPCACEDGEIIEEVEESTTRKSKKATSLSNKNKQKKNARH